MQQLLLVAVQVTIAISVTCAKCGHKIEQRASLSHNLKKPTSNLTAKVRLKCKCGHVQDVRAPFSLGESNVSNATSSGRFSASRPNRANTSSYDEDGPCDGDTCRGCSECVDDEDDEDGPPSALNEV